MTKDMVFALYKTIAFAVDTKTAAKIRCSRSGQLLTVRFCVDACMKLQPSVERSQNEILGMRFRRHAFFAESI